MAELPKLTCHWQNQGGGERWWREI